MYWLDSIKKFPKTRFKKPRRVPQDQIRIITADSDEYHHGHDQSDTEEVSLIRSPISSAESFSDTPPPLVFHRSPFCRVPLPDLCDEPVTLHPLLAYDRLPSILWEVIQTPLMAHLSSHLPTYSPELYHWKSLSALNPPHTGSMTIKFDPLEKFIVIFPRGNYITIGDILSAIYTDSRKQATERHFSELGLDLNVLLSHLPQPSAPSSELASPPATPEFTLVDHQDAAASNVRGMLEYRTFWAGLTPSTCDPDVWVCHTRSSSKLHSFS
ncbi:hypothetical protein BJ165DRAFT_1452605 [Panaeolus papilionaceus]|nr:hypothetical protein BJ165DRAFT_1452605 [Panaeolus papilionaceus]